MMPLGNPCGFAGFAYLEFGAADCSQVVPIMEMLGFERSDADAGLCVMRQGPVHAVIDARPGSFARRYAELHGPTLAGLGLKVRDPALAWNRAIASGASALPRSVPDIAGGLHSIKAMGGIGLHFVEDDGATPGSAPVPAAGAIDGVDHITFNVATGQRSYWNRFLEQAFGFERVFEAELVVDGTRSMTTVMRSPCTRISLACNEPLDADSPLHRQMRAFNGEGLQHLAFSTPDIFALARRLDRTALEPLPVPAAHYVAAGARARRAGVAIETLRELDVMLDGSDETPEAWMFQRFTRPVLGPSFFEFVQRVNFEQGFVQRTAQTLLDTVAKLEGNHG